MTENCSFLGATSQQLFLQQRHWQLSDELLLPDSSSFTYDTISSLVRSSHQLLQQNSAERNKAIPSLSSYSF